MIQIQSLKSRLFKNVAVDVLRLDLSHPVVSGNKWFKLRYYLREAAQQGKTTLATFGGAYSNHIVATAFAGREAGFRTIGIIRGEKPPQLSMTLQDSMGYGMELVFVSREKYADKKEIINSHHEKDWYWINEGGYGRNGMLGAQEILKSADSSEYTHIVCACGTGTTLAGLTAAALPHQSCIGVSVLKGHETLEWEIMELLEGINFYQLPRVSRDYHFGGYAKHPPALITWMNELWHAEGLPTDIVYTGKLFYAVRDLISKGFFLPEHKLLVVHSGGLQGNRGLLPGTLDFL